MKTTNTAIIAVLALAWGLAIGLAVDHQLSQRKLRGLQAAVAGLQDAASTADAVRGLLNQQHACLVKAPSFYAAGMVCSIAGEVAYQTANGHNDEHAIVAELAAKH